MREDPKEGSLGRGKNGKIGEGEKAAFLPLIPRGTSWGCRRNVKIKPKRTSGWRFRKGP